VPVCVRCVVFAGLCRCLRTERRHGEFLRHRQAPAPPRGEGATSTDRRYLLAEKGCISTRRLAISRRVIFLGFSDVIHYIPEIPRLDQQARRARVFSSEPDLSCPPAGGAVGGRGHSRATTALDWRRKIRGFPSFRLHESTARLHQPRENVHPTNRPQSPTSYCTPMYHQSRFSRSRLEQVDPSVLDPLLRGLKHACLATEQPWFNLPACLQN